MAPMAEMTGYACAGLAALVFALAGWRLGRDASLTTLVGGVGPGAMLQGAAIALIDPAGPLPLAFIPLALIAGMTLALASSLDETEPDGDRNGS
jgi:hypothetical protein